MYESYSITNPTKEIMPRPPEEKLFKLGFKKYQKVEPVYAMQMEKPFKCNTLEGDDIKGKAGDYLCVGVDGEQWPIDKDIFEKTYREISS
jgi:hypothetical protein